MQKIPPQPNSSNSPLLIHLVHFVLIELFILCGAHAVFFRAAALWFQGASHRRTSTRHKTKTDRPVTAITIRPVPSPHTCYRIISPHILPFALRVARMRHLVVAYLAAQRVAVSPAAGLSSCASFFWTENEAHTPFLAFEAHAGRSCMVHGPWPARHTPYAPPVLMPAKKRHVRRPLASL